MVVKSMSVILLAVYQCDGLVCARRYPKPPFLTPSRPHQMRTIQMTYEIMSTPDLLTRVRRMVGAFSMAKAYQDAETQDLILCRLLPPLRVLSARGWRVQGSAQPDS
jgi:hypothetical protein